MWDPVGVRGALLSVFPGGSSSDDPGSVSGHALGSGSMCARCSPGPDARGPCSPRSPRKHGDAPNTALCWAHDTLHFGTPQPARSRPGRARRLEALRVHLPLPEEHTHSACNVRAWHALYFQKQRLACPGFEPRGGPAPRTPGLVIPRSANPFLFKTSHHVQKSVMPPALDISGPALPPGDTSTHVWKADGGPRRRWAVLRVKHEGAWLRRLAHVPLGV